MSGTAPVENAARIRALDALRGVALFGILVANVRQMFLPWEIGGFPAPVGGGEGAAWIDWALYHALVDMKFLTLFSLLFGVGFGLQHERLAGRGGGFGWIYLRRVLILALFGIAHGLLLYPAEVLLPYAVAGLLLLLAHRLSPDALLRLGLVLLGGATVWSYQIGSLGRISAVTTGLTVALLAACMAAWRRSWPLALGAWAVIVLGAGGALTLRSDLSPGAAGDFRDARRDLLAMTTGDAAGWPEEFRARREGSFEALVSLHAGQYADVLLYFAILLLWRTLGLFMIGAGLFRRGLLARAAPRLWKRVAAAGLGLGLPSSLVATWLHGREIQGRIDWRFPELLHEWSALPLAAGIAGAVVVLHGRQEPGGPWSLVEAAGRMALTNYLAQSLVMAALAEPWGLGLYGKLGGPALTAVAIAGFVVLALLSRAWLAGHPMGPMEWLWRCGTYWRWLPNR